MRGIFLLALSMVILSSCTTVTTEPKGKWKVLNKSKNVTVPNSQMKSSFVPSGTEIIFTQSKVFNEKNNYINIELSPEKRCHLSTSLEKQKEVTLEQETVLTVVGYRGETEELVLSEPSYQQFYLSCLGQHQQKRKTSSVKKETPKTWKKVSIAIEDIHKMAPLFKVKYIPQ